MPLLLVLLIYNLLLPFALLVLLPVSVLKMRRRGGYGSKFWQRFGFFDKATAARLEAVSGKCRWVHAVSVGEVNVARKLIRELLKREPGTPVVLSVTTSTGYAVACEKAPDELTVIYSPVDLALVVGPVFARIRPRQFILVEAEVWPNLVRVMQRARVPVVLVNARLSPRSERRYRKFRWFTAPVFGMLDKVLVQEPEDVARWEGIGAGKGRVAVTGSIKFDQLGQASSNPERVGEFRKLLSGVFGGVVPRVVLLASSHAGEEQAMAEIWNGMKSEFPDAALLIAPRHAERRAEVLIGVTAAGLRGTLRSELPEPRLDAAPALPGGHHSDLSLAEDPPNMTADNSSGISRGDLAGNPGIPLANNPANNSPAAFAAADAEDADDADDAADAAATSAADAASAAAAAAPFSESALRPEVLVVDSTGELRDWQALAEVVIIGKSFLAKGGQNPVEAIAAGVPVLTGPHMENFAALMILLKSAHGICQVDGLAEVAPAVRNMLSSPGDSRAMSTRGRTALERHSGATRRTAEVLLLADQA
ncbi:MAG: Three-deoxy-D-manno-octulosonic-acid transferase domain protein [Verrucomicrobiales bacterium]|nr:Three-deoxy-D-manno-octulosonic-acid transferase domain protein [Verrucomicrobiales bacterium]